MIRIRAGCRKQPRIAPPSFYEQFHCEYLWGSQYDGVEQQEAQRTKVKQFQEMRSVTSSQPINSTPVADFFQAALKYPSRQCIGIILRTDLRAYRFTMKIASPTTSELPLLLHFRSLALWKVIHPLLSSCPPTWGFWIMASSIRAPPGTSRTPTGRFIRRTYVSMLLCFG